MERGDINKKYKNALKAILLFEDHILKTEVQFRYIIQV
jgi:hypothetical protein